LVKQPQIPKALQFHAHWIARLATGGQEVFWEKAKEWDPDHEPSNIARLQEILGVTVDGVMGPETARAMQRVYAELSQGMKRPQKVAPSPPTPRRTRWERMLDDDQLG